MAAVLGCSILFRRPQNSKTLGVLKSWARRGNAAAVFFCAILRRMRIAMVISVLALAAACTPSGTSDVVTSVLETSPTLAASTTSTTSPPTTTTTEATVDADPVADEVFIYVVVAEENSRRLTVIDPGVGCVEDGDGGSCDLEPLHSFDLADRPHNLASVGSVVYATHPDAGSVSRIDLVVGQVLTVFVGREPHDIKYDPVSGELIVADEAGRRLLMLDPETLRVIGEVELPGQPHDLAIGDGVIWVTLIGRSELVRVTGNAVEVLSATGSPHDLIVDRNGLIWYSNWGSKALNIYDPETGLVPDAPSGVGEPQHFAIAPDGTVWISDIAGDAIVGFTSEQPVAVDVGTSPHHLVFARDTIVVAVSGTGEAVFVRNGEVVARSQLTPGLHGVAVVELTEPLGTPRR